MTSSIKVRDPGIYSVQIQNYKCTSFDSVQVDFADCETLLVMPNIFTPNDDQYNSVFKPMELNYIDSGTITIYDRWGLKMFTGDIFRGWDGKSNGNSANSGIYYYTIYYSDKRQITYSKKGIVTLAR